MVKEKSLVCESSFLSEEDRRALRGSRFASLPSLPQQHTHPRLAHPGGSLATNKAAALAKFLERKLQEPGGLACIDPALVEMAVKNAKETVNASGSSDLGRMIRHVDSFNDGACENSLQGLGETLESESKNQDAAKGMRPKRNKEEKKNKKKLKP